MEQEVKRRRPWRRWVVLVLMIVGCVLGGGLASLPSWAARLQYAGFPAVQPEIAVAPERLIEEPLTKDFLGLGALTHGKFSLGPLYLVNTMPTLIVTIILILMIAYFTNRSLKRSAQGDLVPRGIGNLMEAFFELLYNLTEGSAGSKWARAIFPWFATIMFYVLLANLLKLIPGFESVGLLRQAAEGHAAAGALLTPEKIENGYILVPFFRGISVDLNFTAALAVIAVVMIQVIGFRAQGFGYISKFFNTRRMFKVPFFGAMDFLVGLLELISELSKILSFAFRLFGNMFAGIVLVAIVAGLLGAFSILPAMVMMFELFVGVIQAFVFGMLTMVFMAQATQGHGEEHAEAH